MDYLSAVFLGLAAAAGAVLLPGMLNMTVVKTALRCGRWEARQFAAGIAATYVVQAGIGLIGANWLRQNEGLLNTLREFAVPVFFGLAVMFLVAWYRKRIKRKRGGAVACAEEEEEEPNVPFYLQGASLALMNMLAIPYFFTIGTWLMADGHLSAQLIHKIIFVLSAATGVLTILTGYAFLAKVIEARATLLTQNIQLVLGMLFMILASVQGWRVWVG